MLGQAANERLHLIVHDYSTFAGAADLAEQVVHFRGGIDSVVAPIGGWWAGRKLIEIDEADWQSAFVGLATTHMAVLRACLPHMTAQGAYSVIVGDSATWPVPESGLVSMEQAALLMMQRVVQAELKDERRMFTLMLGAVATRGTSAGTVTADQVGSVAVAVSAAVTTPGRVIPLHDSAEVNDALTSLAASQS